jgi:dTDP-glucose 4,6-dehydratase
MKLLVTGGCGFIGSNFIMSVLGKHSVVNLDKLTYAGNINNIPEQDGYRLVIGDICNRGLVDKLVSECDAVVHFAAETHVDRSIEDAEDFIQTNIVGTYTLLEAARKYNKRFHHVSTDEVFGSLDKWDAPFNEITAYRPNSPYSASKAASDHLVMSYYSTYGLHTTISNCSNNYGPFQNKEKLIPKIITNFIKGEKVPLYGNGLNIRDWVFVDDHNSAIELILEKGLPGETYCIGGNCELTNLEIIENISSKFDIPLKDAFVSVKDRPGHDFRYAINCNKLKNKLGWVPKVSFEEGIQQTIEWYKQNESWWNR